MWLKKLTLNNFQKHEDLTLDFTPGVNILYGYSDAGKSCIRRAIGFVFFNEPRTDDIIRKEGTKKTSVTAILDDDTEVERVKSASINRYVIRHPGQKDIVYDSIGAEIPEEVQKVLQMKLIEIDKSSLNLNIAEQVCLPFLTGSDFPASARMKLFNKLTGNDLLDEVAQLFNKEIIGNRRSLTVEENVVSTNNPKIEQLDKDIKSRKITADFVIEKLKFIGDNYRKIEGLKDIQVKLYAIRMAIKAYTDDLTAIKLGDEVKIASLKVQTETLGALSVLKEALHLCSNKLYLTKNELMQIKTPEFDIKGYRAKIDRLNVLNQVSKGLKGVIEGLELVLGQMTEIKVTELNGTQVRVNIEKVNNLNKIYSKLKELMVKNQQIINESHLVESVLPTQEKEYSDILKEAKICPVCKQDTSKCEVHL